MPMLTPTKSGVRPEAPDTRCSILVMAERLFREIGYRKTTVSDIAKALRMSPANVYRFFESKRQINEAVAERLLFDMETELATIAGRSDVPASERLLAFIEASNRFSTERFTANRRLHEMVEVAMTESWEVVHRHIVRFDEILCRLVADGVRSGEFKVEDPMVAARCLHAAIIRFVHPALIVQCADEPGPTLDEMMAFALRGLGAEPFARPSTAKG
jgi:AcrR family transcriptional regulator